MKRFRILKDAKGQQVQVSDTFANVAASTTDSALVAAREGKRIVVFQATFVTGDTATTAVFNSKGSGAGTACSMTFQNAANGGAALCFNEEGYFITKRGEGLSLTTGAGSTTGVQINYGYIE